MKIYDIHLDWLHLPSDLLKLMMTNLIQQGMLYCLLKVSLPTIESLLYLIFMVLIEQVSFMHLFICLNYSFLYLLFRKWTNRFF